MYSCILVYHINFAFFWSRFSRTDIRVFLFSAVLGWGVPLPFSRPWHGWGSASWPAGPHSRCTNWKWTTRWTAGGGGDVFVPERDFFFFFSMIDLYVAHFFLLFFLKYLYSLPLYFFIVPFKSLRSSTTPPSFTHHRSPPLRGSLTIDSNIF